MRLNLKKIKKKSIKIVIQSLVIFPIIFYLNAGSLTDTYWKVVQSVIFTIILILALTWSQLKKSIFLLGLFLIIIMVLLYVVGLIDWADLVGSTGIGIIMLNLLIYLPQIVKVGYIKKM